MENTCHHLCVCVRLSEITDISSLVSAGLKIALKAEDLLKSVEKIQHVLKKKRRKCHYFYSVF